MDEYLHLLEQLIEVDNTYLEEYLKLHIKLGGFDHLFAYIKERYPATQRGWLPINILQSIYHVDTFEMDRQWHTKQLQHFVSNFDAFKRIIFSGGWGPDWLTEPDILRPCQIFDGLRHNNLVSQLLDERLELAFVRTQNISLIGYSIINTSHRIIAAQLLSDVIRLIYDQNINIAWLPDVKIREIWPAKKIAENKYLLLTGKILAIEDIGHVYGYRGNESRVYVEPWILPAGQLRDMEHSKIITLT